MRHLLLLALGVACALPTGAAPYVVEFNGDRQHSNHGAMFPPGLLSPGHFSWQVIACPTQVQDNGYLVSVGRGGRHPFLGGFPAWLGNRAIWAGNTTSFPDYDAVSWHSGDGLKVGEWGVLTATWDGEHIWCHVNGVPTSKQPWLGPRGSVHWSGSNGRVLYVGGSDHSNARARIASVMATEGFHPFGNYSRPIRVVHSPSFPPPSQVYTGPDSFRSVSFLSVYVNYGGPGQLLIPDLSGGYDHGEGRPVPHPGVLTRMGDSAYPRPAWVTDSTFPWQSATAAPTPPSGFYDPPLPVPAGAEAFTSWAADDRLPLWQNVGLPPLEHGGQSWQQGCTDPASTAVPFGVHHNRAVWVHDDRPGLAWINAPTADHVATGLRDYPDYGSVGMGLAVRVQDRCNGYVAVVFGNRQDLGSRRVRVWRYVGGFYVPPDGYASPPEFAGHIPGWQQLAFGAQGDTLTVSTDGVVVGTLTGQTSFQAATGLGFAQGWHPVYEVGDGLWRLRWWRGDW